jgi:inner membrane protein
MDPVTHTLLGAVASYALFGGRLGRRAAAIGAVAGAFPDVDNFISSKEDPLLYVEYHRYFTHSIVFAIVGSLIAVLPWILRRQFRPQWKLFWLCALPAYLSHCLLDAATTYGTQILWPFTRQRYGWDLIAIVDPIFTLALLAGLIFALTRRQVRVAGVTFLFCAAYIALGGLQHHRAQRLQIALAQERGHVIERSRVMPAIGNNLVWRSLYESNGMIYSDRIRVGWFSRGQLREGGSVALATPADLTPLEAEGNRMTRGFERFAWFSDGWVARSAVDETVLGDMRYSMSMEAFDPIWGIRFVRENGKVHLEWVSRTRDRRMDVKELWSEIAGKQEGYRPATTEK